VNSALIAPVKATMTLSNISRCFSQFCGCSSLAFRSKPTSRLDYTMRYWWLSLGLACLSGIVPVAPAFPQSVAVNNRQLEALQIRVEKAETASSEAVILLPATVVPPLNSRVATSAPFAGTVIHVDVLVGQHVREGTPLVTIASREMLEALARLRQSEVELQAAEVIAKRHKELADRKVGSLTKAEETQTEVNKLRVVTEQLRRILSLGNLKVNSDGSYTLSASRAGRVIETRVTAGSNLDAMAAAVIIDTSDELWVQAQLPASFVNRIGEGDDITIANAITGRVISVGSSVDPLTRSATLLARLPKGSGLVAGQMVTATVSKPASKGALSVPSRSITRIAGTPTVFLRVGDGFTATPVSIRGKTAETATIEGEIKPGQEVAVTGIVQLEKMLAGG
jgi:cobalt-zinc-cadmium efflux system membrane fusion protein